MNRCTDPNPIRAVPRLRQLLAAAFAWVLAVGPVLANPTGAQTVAGQVTTVSSGNQLLITNSPGAIINWQSFSIMPGELTRFIQQNSASSVLNRITGQDPSQIMGALQSNGKVFLINPNGILFGAGAQVNVNGLVASSLNLSNADFLAGKLHFSSAGKPGDVSNHGAITTPSGGQVYLIAPNVTNDGIITSPGGDVMLAAGQSVELADSNDPDVRVVVSAPGNQALNVGKVVAESGRVGIYGALVNQLGLVSANSAVAGTNGKVVFKASGDAMLGEGSVTTATGTGTGGEVQVLGNRVGVTADAVIDASGQTGGGTVLIGGDIHGTNASMQNAALTYVGPMAQIKADALQSGAGGKVIVWSDQQTQMYGHISARGGEQGGAGGFVETSSQGLLDFQGLVDVRAPQGTVGTLLLDPSDITIDSGPSTVDVTLPGSTPFTITALNSTSTLSVTDLQNELGLGNVTIATSSGATAPLGGTISVAAPISWSNANSLTLAADRSVIIDAPVTAAAGTLVLTAAGGDITQAVNASVPATISVASLAASAPAGAVTLTEPTNNVSGAIAGVGLQGFAFVNAGAITVGTAGSVSGITSGNGTVSLSAASGNITQVGGPIVAPALAAVASNGDVELGVAGNSVGIIAGSSNGGLGFSLANSNAFTVGTVAGVGGIPAANGINSSTNALGSGVFLQASSGDITIDAPVNAVGSSVSVVSAAGAIMQGAGGSITANSLRVNAGGATGIGSSNVPLLAAVATLASVDSQGPAYISNSGNLTVNYISALGAVNVSSAGTLGTATAVACDCTTRISGSAVTLSSHASMLVGSGYTVTATDGVSLYAGYDASSGTYTGSSNSLSVAGSVSGSTVSLFSGGAINVTGTVAGALTQMPLQYSSVPTPPTLSQCIATPTLAGCSAVLPSLAQCTSTPTAPGCSVVLPTLAQCTSTPTAPGCTVVLPTLAQCTSTPTGPGCSVVLPTLAQCTSTPTAPGCSVVLPTLAQCTSGPTSPGCSVVLPTLAQCTSTPMAPGCSAVLPTLAQCTATPAVPGCSVVLPTLAACTANPAALGCSVVLPTLAQCTSTPTSPGCSAVLPTLAACTANPAALGCSVVLPTLAQCTSTPTSPGCSAVLPTLAACTANPAALGCGAVLPTLAQCTSAPSLQGCSAVLPTLAQCTANPSLAGCNSVLPAPGICTIAPTSQLCQVLAPPVAQNTSSEPVSQAINTTVNIINVVNGTTSAIVPRVSTGSTSPGASGGTTGGTTGSTTGGTDASVKSDKSDTLVAKDAGAKKDEPVKKLYCN
jgi:filamentous hemagglutinin family protein